MAEHSFPFDSSALNEAQWSRMAGSWQTNGVDAPGPWDQALKVLSTGQPFQLLVTAGNAKCAGFHYELDANTMILFAENKTTSERTDRVVLKLDRETNTVALAVKQGGITAPPVDRSWNSLEIPLATFIVRANSDTVVPADLVDVREFVSSGVQMLSPAHGEPGARQLAEGQLGYDPTAKKFLAKDGAREFELGPPQDLSPYLTKGEAVMGYAVRNHQHNMAAYPSSVSDIHSDAAVLLNQIRCWGRWASVSLIVSPPPAWGTVVGGSAIGIIADTRLRPTIPVHITSYQQDNSGPHHGVARVTLNPDGWVVFSGSTEPWMAARYIHAHATYLCSGISPW
ncbi:hypothetical protein [Nonomuraea sp. NPDC023979]|uniref:hypothetical protein n=1 Tax=Nonomuraea sp. NPDC023979 TaxID=3154796 RepID=UPI003408187B